MLKQPDPKRNKVCQASIKYIIRWAAPLGLPMFFGEEQENK